VRSRCTCKKADPRELTLHPKAVHLALREIVAIEKFKRLMAKNAGKLTFEGHGE